MLAACCGMLFVLTSVPDRFGFSYLQYTDPTVLLALLYAYALQMLTFVTLVTTFFTSETLVVLATCFAVLVSFLPYLLFVELTVRCSPLLLRAAEHCPAAGHGHHRHLRERP
ncbi:hypothetical protein HPB50_014249 [Hyalomma asiaticum]|uniref:Uncharacterized protein n=1 Tax=Hyalomma asiaticum TaxID=266040 RepID=A0ACB7S6W6_HYAAI|nr:hypothetical protein HPB50_014249 [Hyalomma asiaticum]